MIQKNSKGRKSLLARLAHMLYKPFKFSALCFEKNRLEKFLLMEAFLWLGLSRLMVRLFPFSWTARFMGRYMDDSSRFVTNPEIQAARAIGFSVETAADYTPWKSVCLPQAMAAQWMLKRRKIPAILYLGIDRNPDKASGLSAHAWLRCGNTIITGAQGHETFAVVSIFSTGPIVKTPLKRKRKFIHISSMVD